MKVYPKEYTKSEFLKFMRKLGVDEDVISDFEIVPDIIKKNGSNFRLYISSRWYDVGNTHYEFELNYYSSKLMEYLFSLKVYNDIEISVNHLICELKKHNYY